MHKILAALSAVALTAMLAVPAIPAMAQTINNNAAPKPLEVAPTPPEQKQTAQEGGLPQEFIDMRRKMKKEFNDWMKEDQEIQKQCSLVHTVKERLACEYRQKASQARLDAVRARTRDMLRKIDNWRRKEAGLPPPPWWSKENQAAGQASNGNPDLHPVQPVTPAGKSPPSVLLPMNGMKMPANTY